MILDLTATSESSFEGRLRMALQGPIQPPPVPIKGTIVGNKIDFETTLEREDGYAWFKGKISSSGITRGVGFEVDGGF
jgi:hypothetical protein